MLKINALNFWPGEKIKRIRSKPPENSPTFHQKYNRYVSKAVIFTRPYAYKSKEIR